MWMGKSGGEGYLTVYQVRKIGVLYLSIKNIFLKYNITLN